MVLIHLIKRLKVYTLREGTKAQLHNFVVTGTSGMGECLELEGGSSTVTTDQASNGDTVISNSVFACDENFKDSKATDGTVLLDAEDWVLNQNDDNSTADRYGHSTKRYIHN